MRILLAVVMILALGVMPAVAGDLLLKWDAPTKNADGTPISHFDKAPAAPGKADYKVYQGTTVGGPYPTVQAVVGNSTGTTNYTVTGLTIGTKYCFTATALNTFGKESAKSNEACETVTVVPGPPLLLRFQ